MLVVDEVLVERLRDAGRDATVLLALEDERIDDRAGVVDRNKPNQLDLPRLRVDLDDRHVAAEGKSGRALELLCCAQILELAVRSRPPGELSQERPRWGAPTTWKRPAAVSSLMSSGLASR